MDKTLGILCAEDALDCVARDGIEKEQQEDGQQGDEDDLDDGPLVVVPDDVTDRLEWIQEPHEARVRSDRFLQAIGILSTGARGILLGLLSRQKYELGLNLAL